MAALGDRGRELGGRDLAPQLRGESGGFDCECLRIDGPQPARELEIVADARAQCFQRLHPYGVYPVLCMGPPAPKP